MIPAIKSNPKFSKVVISTGNILNVIKNPAIKSNDDLLEGLKLTLKCGQLGFVDLRDTDGHVLRASQELQEKITEHERSNISIGAKVFLNKYSTSSVKEALQALLNILKVQHVDNVVLAYHPKADSNTQTKLSPPAVANGESHGVLKWSSKDSKAVADLKQLWEVLENYAEQKQILQIGVSDLDMESLSQLYTTSSVHPSIAQINLSSCCVVPPALQEFCNEHDIQLLTHSDPEVLLEDEEFIIPDYKVDWVVRYQVQVRCRGVLAVKGYIVGASNNEKA